MSRRATERSNVDAELTIPRLAVGEIVRPPPFVLSGDLAEKSYYLLASDIHIGAAEVDYDLLSTDLAWARKVGARVLLGGDVFDAIFSRDKRYTPTTLDERLRGRDAALNAAVDLAFDTFADHADLIDMIGYGNHETAVLKYGASDMLRFLHERLQEHVNQKSPGHRIQRTGYTGAYVRAIRRKHPNSRGHAKMLKIWFHHGMANAAPVTKGMIAFHRAATYVRDAHVIWMGHLHTRWVDDAAAIFIPDKGDRLCTHGVKHVMSGAYTGGKPQFNKKGDFNLSWATEKGFAPQGKGAIRMAVQMTRDYELKITCEV